MFLQGVPPGAGTDGDLRPGWPALPGREHRVHHGTGWRRKEVVGRPEAEVRLWSEQEPGAGFERALVETGRIASVDVRLRANTEIVSDYLMSAETVDVNGQPRVVSLMLDITERKRMEIDLLTGVQSVMQDIS